MPQPPGDDRDAASAVQAAITSAWSAADPADPAVTVARFEALLGTDPQDARLLFEAASAHDWAGRPGTAAPLYEAAFAAGLTGDLLRRGLLQYGSTLRNLGRIDEAVTTLRQARAAFPASPSIPVYLSLALVDAGRGREAVADLIDLLLDIDPPAELARYQRALRAYAADLRAAPRAETPEGWRSRP